MLSSVLRSPRAVDVNIEIMRSFVRLREMLTSPNAMFGLSDAGAHCNSICDGTFPTTAVTHWTRDRRRGEPLGLEEIFVALCGDDDKGGKQ